MPPLIYLDHASTSWPKHPAVAEAMAAAVSAPLGTPARGSHALATSAARIFTGLREALTPIVGTGDPDRIILTGGATHSLNLAILGLLGHRRDRPRVVTSAIEHNALRRPLESLAARGLIDLIAVPADAECRLDAFALVDSISTRTALVAITHASNVTGVIQPVEQVASALEHRRRAGLHTPLLLIDASQTAGLIPLDVDRLGIDLAAFSGHKALRGPAGTGALYVGPRAFSPTDARPAQDQPQLPVFFGGTGHDSESPDMPATLPSRFEPGTPNIPGFAGLLAAVERWSPALADRTLGDGRAMLSRLRDTVVREARDLVQFHRPASAAGTVPVLSLTIANLAPSDAAVALESSFGIIARAGLHCAPGAHAAMNTLSLGGTLRISSGPGTTPAEIDAAAHALIELARAANP